MISRPRLFWFPGAVIGMLFIASLALLCVACLLVLIYKLFIGSIESSDAKMFFFLPVCLLNCFLGGFYVWKYIYKCSRYLIVKEGSVYVRYLFNPKGNYILNLSEMKSFYYRQYMYVMYNPKGPDKEYQHYQAYLLSKKNNLLWLYADTDTHGNFEKLVKALKAEGVKEEECMISLSAYEAEQAWKGGMLYLNKDDNQGREESEQDDDAFDNGQDELLKMVEKEGGLDVWDYMENMCLLPVAKDMADQVMDFLSVLDDDSQQEIIEFFHPFGNSMESGESRIEIIMERNSERRVRLSKNLGVLARTSKFKKMKVAPEWQELRDIINKDKTD